MHVSVNVRSGDPRTPDDLVLTTHCLTIFVALDAQGKAAQVPRWRPTSDEDRRLETHAKHLIDLRARLAPPYRRDGDLRMTRTPGPRGTTLDG